MQAVEKAKGYGACQYVNSLGAPVCVVGQFLNLYNKDLLPKLYGNMERIQCLISGDSYDGVEELAEDEVLQDYEYLLSLIQGRWDTGESVGGPEAQTRQKMRDIVEEHFA